MSIKHENISIVLVEPQSPGNIGMVCRAMKNMGLSKLRIVKGCDRFQPESLKFAVAARNLLEEAALFNDLKSAISDCTVTVATTRRHGKYRQEIISPEEVAAIIRNECAGSSKAAIVFGREDSGLTTEELSLCRWHATIPSSDDYGSLNLAQSVLLFCYELNRTGRTLETSRDIAMAKSEEIETFFEQLRFSMQKIGFLNEQNPDHIMRSLRRIYFRAALDSREVSILRGMLTQINWATDNFDGRK